MPCRLEWATTPENYRMTTIDATLRHALEVSGRDLILTLDPALQGLPETAHGGSVLAVFDALADAATPREVSGIYRRRVPLGVPLTLLRTRADSTETFVLSDSSATVLVDGRVAPLAAATAAVVDDAPLLEAPDGGDARAHPLPVSRACFACGTDNELGLRVRLEFDADAVRGTWQPRACFRRADGSLAPAALTTLLDEAAFWLGVLATGESGMTTELRVSLHRPAPFGARVTVTGARAAVRVIPAAIYFLSNFHRVAPAVVAADLMKAFSITAASLGALAAIYPYVFAVMALVGGSLVETLGPRLTIASGATTMALGAALFGLAPVFVVAVAGRLLVGLGASVILIAWLTLAAEWYRPQQFATISGWTQTIGNVGTLMASSPLALAVEVIGWRSAFVLVGGVTLLPAL